METIILILALVIETGFAIFCLYTKSYQNKIRSYLRIGEFTAFSIFILAADIQWNFRWYALAAWLFILAVFSLGRLLGAPRSKKVDSRGYKFSSARIVLKSIGMLVLVFISLIPAFVFPEHSLIETTGRFKVATAQYTYTDTSRIETYSDSGQFRTLNAAFWYPQLESENTLPAFPLVVFSHGSFGIKTSNELLFNELASHGYVVCSIDHTYQSLFTTNPDGSLTWIDMGYMKEVSAQDAHTKKEQSFEFFQKWMEIRTADINFVIDTILSESGNNPAAQVYKLVDRTKIGVMGHSLGGSAALAIGRMRNDVKAVIALELPFLADIVGVKDNQFVFLDTVYPIPVLNIYSDASWGHLSEWAQYAENYRLLSDTEANAFNVYISAAGHLDLTDLALTSPILTRILNQQSSSRDSSETLKIINRVSLAFFDRFLKGVGNFNLQGIY